ncbi:hypothetical protein GCM10010404_20200 [Nonomuraea africana]|uniref:DUF3179 domain-containing protein n=1 Tax=Nonomuraea africana TaxID=46171 RepID=A0ABR9KTB8_9ACTN|nr:hypothetical protein [Nonomuraea africana]MBE1565279.1 hypothetical protein [Nonomuraea africana]
MPVNERRIAEELRLMADEAQPVDPVAYATRAGAGASRRRRLSWSLAGLVTATALVAGVFVVSPLHEGGDIAAQVAELPRNTPEQLRLVRDCMPGGGPVHNMDPGLRIPEHGRREDFRVLVEYRDKKGSTALVGSTAGFVLCTPAEQKDMAQPPVFTYWGYRPPGSLSGLAGDLTVDAYDSHDHPYVVGPDREQKNDYYLVIAGRVTPRVQRVEIVWKGGRRTDARLANGFFLGRMLTGLVPAPEDLGEGTLKPEQIVDTPPATVTAYDQAGRVIGQEQNVHYSWRGPTSRPSPTP